MKKAELIKSVETFIEKFGVKKSHIAKQIGCTPVELSHFLSNRRDLRPECHTRLVNYIGK